MSASVRDTSTNRQGVRVALVGDYNPNITAHKAIPLALQLAQQSMQVPLAFQWVATADIKETIFESFDGIWCTPGSPYQSEEGALSAIQYARLRALPFLGSCAGFQYALIEYARNELNWANAAHAETAPASNNPIVSPLECALIERGEQVNFTPGSCISKAYGTTGSYEEYRCAYGLNTDTEAKVLSGKLKAAGYNAAAEVRAVELHNHPFFIATLFQSERQALKGLLPPLVKAFIEACITQAVLAGRKGK
jgi:CTP synthase (UTP-ammonia lyase)